LIFSLATPKPFVPINAPTDCKIMESVYSSAGVYIKSLCIDIYARTYEDSRVNCVTRGMRLYRIDSVEAIAVVLNAADINWTFNYWYVSLHIYENATGPLYVSNENPSGKCEITAGNRTAYRQSVCEYIEKSCKFRLHDYLDISKFRYLDNFIGKIRYYLDQCFSNCVPPEIFRCAAKFLRIFQFARIFEKLGANFKNFPYKVCREKIFNFLVCREPKKF
jgi:hypothetical protein